MKILDFIFPKFCYGCSKIGEYICSTCFKKITILKNQKCPSCMKSSLEGKFCSYQCKNSYHFDQLIVCADYNKNALLRKIIHQFKFKFSKELVVVLSKIINKQLTKFDLTDYIIIPVPLHKKDARERGYNQTLLLSKRINDNKTLDCLLKVKITKKQRHLNKTERLENLHNVFTINESLRKKIMNKKVVLLDDVSTTLCTLNECSKILKKNGVKYITGLVLARA